MKMVMAVVQADDAQKITDSLVEAGHRVTRMATTGGWLRRENVTLLMGVEDEKVSAVLQVLKQAGHHRTTYISMPSAMAETLSTQMIDVEIGGATVFVLNVERFEYY